MWREHGAPDRLTATDRPPLPGTGGEGIPSLDLVVRYFEEALGEQALWEGSQVVRFERWMGFVWGTSWRRGVVSARAGGWKLEWWTNDDFGLSELREFFEAPFFALAESKRFYRWLGEGGWHCARGRDGQLRMGVSRSNGVLYVKIQWLSLGTPSG